jgi:hypothetical protein
LKGVRTGDKGNKRAGQMGNTFLWGYQRSNPTEIVRYKRIVKAVFH